MTSKTKAVIPVHLFGQPADMTALRETVGDDVAIVEDAAQAIGASYDGKPAGSIGDIGCISFYPTKNLGGFGDSGMLTTTSDELADRLRLLRVHGMRPRYYHSVMGINSRLDTMQAVVLNVKLPHLRTWSDARADNARRYEAMFKQAGLGEAITLPTLQNDVESVWNQYTIRLPEKDRDALRTHLAANNVGTEIYYPVPLHKQECFADLELRVPLPETELAAKEVLSLPIFPTMTPEEQETVVYRIAEFTSAQKVSGKAA